MNFYKKIFAVLCIVFCLLVTCSCGSNGSLDGEHNLFYIKHDSSIKLRFWDALKDKSKTIGHGSLRLCVSDDRAKVFFGQDEGEEGEHSPYYEEYDLYYMDLTEGSKERLVADNVLDHTCTPDGRYLLYVTEKEELVLCDIHSGTKEYIVSDREDVFVPYHLSASGSVI